MAVLRSLASKYKAISKPSLLAKSSGSSSLASAAKKQQAAEDAIYDNQYSDGQITPEVYQQHLQERLGRGDVTPLQTVTIQKKIGDVSEKVLDSKYEAAYSAGTINTATYQAYQKSKLDKMPADSSAAYIQQKQKVQGLQDKMERENRTAFRVSEAQRIGQLPEDNSNTLHQKAQTFQKLADQARLDGDTQQATTYETQAQGYLDSAKRADINDIITGARLSVSGTPSAGLGVPSADSGSQILSSLNGGSPVVTGGGGAPGAASSSVKTGFSGVTSPAIKNALESLDRNKMVLDRLYQQKQDKAEMIGKYQTAITQASGDQKTQLQIQLNNLIDSNSQIDNQIANTTQATQDIVGRIQEAQSKAAATGFSQEVRKNEGLFTKAENDLETAFSTGKIGKEEYLAKGEALAGTKAQFYDEASSGFAQYGNDQQAQTYMDKVEPITRIKENLTVAKENPDDYEPIATDPGGNMNNLLGKGLKPGDVALVNVRKLKDTGLWDGNYVNDNGVWRRVQYPGQVSDVTGLPTTSAFNRESGTLDQTAYMYRGREKVAVKGVQFTDEQGNPMQKLMPESEVQKLVSQKKLISDGGQFRAPTAQDNQIIQDKANGVKRVAGIAIPVQTMTNKFKDVVKSITNAPAPAQTAGSEIQNFLKNATQGAQGLFGKAKNFAQNAINRVFPQGISLVPKAYAAGDAATKKPYDDLINEVFGPQADAFRRVLDGENGRRVAELDVQNRIDPKTGKWSNTAPVMMRKDPITGNMIPSTDVGLTRINNITYYDFWKRYKNEMTQNGFTGNIKELNDPRKALVMAKMVADKQGGAAWYAAPEDLRNRDSLVSTGQPTATANPNLRSNTSPTATPQLRSTATPKAVSNPGAPAVVDGRMSKEVVAPSPISTALRSVATSAPVQNMVKAVQSYTPPKITVPKITIPQISLPKVNLAPVQNFASQAVQSVQKAAAPVVQNVKNTVSNAVKKATSWLSGLFR